VTTCATPWPGKSIHYRMHPSNLDVLVAAGIDGVALANNHVLDWGRAGLAETLDVLHRRGIRTAGAGADADAAWAPACFVPGGGTRVLLFAIGCGDAGVPSAWAATARRSGVARIDEPDAGEAGRWARRIARIRRDCDIVVASVHWGANWVDTIPAAQRRFARALVESGAVDLVHGHSSHHVLPVEVIRDRLVLHGCGDLVNDYEGIGTQRGVRADVGALYFAELERATGRLRTLRVVPLQRRRLRLLDADADGRRELLARFDTPQQPPLEHEIVPDVGGPDWQLRRRPALPPPAAASAR
jgi:poly-gamma-glutamate synthesis protein (capsule biosynthesis protein)